MSPMKWISEMQKIAQEVNEFKQKLSHKANGADVLRMCESKANKSIINNIEEDINLVRKQILYFAISFNLLLRSLTEITDLAKATHQQQIIFK